MLFIIINSHKPNALLLYTIYTKKFFNQRIFTQKIPQSSNPYTFVNLVLERNTTILLPS